MELHQIFLDMAVLVEAQGEMLDNIEAQVSMGEAFLVCRGGGGSSCGSGAGSGRRACRRGSCGVGVCLWGPTERWDGVSVKLVGPKVLLWMWMWGASLPRCPSPAVCPLPPLC